MPTIQELQTARIAKREADEAARLATEHVDSALQFERGRDQQIAQLELALVAIDEHAATLDADATMTRADAEELDAIATKRAEHVAALDAAQWTDERILEAVETHGRQMRDHGHDAEADAFVARMVARLSPDVADPTELDALSRTPVPVVVPPVEIMRGGEMVGYRHADGRVIGKMSHKAWEPGPERDAHFAAVRERRQISNDAKAARRLAEDQAAAARHAARQP